MCTQYPKGPEEGIYILGLELTDGRAAMGILKTELGASEEQALLTPAISSPAACHSEVKLAALSLPFTLHLKMDFIFKTVFSFFSH